MKKIYLLPLTLCLSFFSCDFDQFPTESISYEDVFRDPLKVEGYITGLYSYLPNEGSYHSVAGAMLSSASDESASTAPSDITLLTDGSLTARSNNPDANWGNSYQYLADINLGLENLHLLTNERQNTIDQYIGEMKFLRAYIHFELVKRYGGIPLANKLFSLDDLNIERNSFEECINFILEDCNEAANLLPDPNNIAFGRASNGAALALKSRVLLYAASPLYNSSGINNDNNPLICYGNYDPDRWELAATAAHEVISLNYYNIFQTRAITDNLNDSQVAQYGEENYRKLFTTITGNKELIFSRTASLNNIIEKDNTPVGFTNGNGRTSPSQQMVDAYGMIDGKYIEDSSYDKEQPYLKRDPRFEASIFYNGKKWPGRAIETFQGGEDMKGTIYSKTGYYLSKFSEPTVVISGSQTNTYHCFPMIRYAEILLNYAEAMNNAYGPDTDPKGYGLTARDALKQIRARVLRPQHTDVTGVTTKEQMNKAIKHERQVELAFEEHRYFDLKRWKEAQNILSKPLMGVIIQKIQDSYTYDYSYVAETRQFQDRLYFYPISQSEMSKNKALVNNPGW
ncbi:RagB/SusD family nutrient uptake outer membrane protein [Proteiniphilum sp. UBA7639]|jgi:hypothetical protein|uniref:RagB/SusD family nutrient uptake outer membrane protein n=1 Tax=Proteiniphilum sp. UBA7639 TaxID=1947289 RepID=UPI0025798B25|nr:RagB/SusD family nutrient uptake outer membrane protein [Proteiniphilum sp. UBA7639]